MVKTFQDVCLRLKQDLSEVDSQCECMLTELDEFEKTMAVKPVEIVGKRLFVIACWITGSVLALYEEHGRKGYMCVVIMENGKLVPYWFENRRIVASKNWWKSQGLMMLSVQEALCIIQGLMDKLTLGNWVDVVSWINRHSL